MQKSLASKKKKHVNRLCSPHYHPQKAILQLMLFFSVFFAFVRNDRVFVRAFLNEKCCHCNVLQTTMVQFFHHCCFKMLQQTTIAVKNHNLNNIIAWQKQILQFSCIVEFGSRFDSTISWKMSLHDIFVKEQFKFLTVFVAKLMRWQCAPWNVGSNQPTMTSKANANKHHGGIVCCVFQKNKNDFFSFCETDESNRAPNPTMQKNYRMCFHCAIVLFKLWCLMAIIVHCDFAKQQWWKNWTVVVTKRCNDIDFH